MSQGCRVFDINLTQKSVDERVSLGIVSIVSSERSGVRSDETGTSPGSNRGSVSGDWGSVNGQVIGLTILVQINATVDEIVVELGWFVGQDGHLAFSADGLLDGSRRSVGDDGGGGLGEWVSEWRAVSVAWECTAVVQTGVGVVVGQNSWGCGVEGGIRLAVLVQIDALREQVIVK